ncbi:MAG: hypothetical protein KF744_07750 [Taibaiella sp.]|nr:hypothetical protein [Taibaiella sp.]
MIVQFNTSSNVNGRERVINPFIDLITEELGRYKEHISRIEAHLTDEDGRKNGGDDKRCVLEARIEGRSPVAVHGHGDTYQQAVDSGIDKLKAALDTIFGKALRHH